MPHLRVAALTGLLVALTGCGWVDSFSRRPAPLGGAANSNRSDAALSGDGRLLASLIEDNGTTRLILQEQGSGRRLALRHWQRQTPHSSPSLSWNGRYLAGLVQQGEQRRVVVEDRLNGRLLRLPLPGGGQPERLSLAPDGSRLAVQVLRKGQWQVEVLGLDGLLEPDLPGATSVLGGGVPQP